MKINLKLIREFRLNGFDKINYTDSEIIEAAEIFYGIEVSESEHLKNQRRKNRKFRLSKKIF